MNRPPLSLRWRLMILILIPLTLISAAAGYWRIDKASETVGEVFDQTLIALAVAVSKDISTSGGEALSEKTSALLNSIYRDRLYYHVHGPDGVFVTGYATPPVKPAGLTVTENVPILYNSDYRGEEVRVVKLMERTSLAGLTGLSAVTVWQPVSARDSIARRIAERAVIVILSLYITVAAVIWFGIKLGLKPLTDLQEAIALRSSDDLGNIRRPIPEEVTGLVETLNDLFGQVSAAISSRDRFISDAAHQLRNPVAGLLSVAEAAKASKTHDDRLIRIDEIITAARHVTRLTNQLLSLERAKDPASASRLAPADLRDIARDAAEHLAREVLSSGTAFDFDIPDESVPVMADSLLLSEAIQNLIDNSMKHGGANNSAIRVSVQAEDGFGKVCVRDHGPGLSASDAETVFARFSQLRPGSGSGLGLPIVSEIARLHGGQAEIIDCNDGARVCLQIPLAG